MKRQVLVFLIFFHGLLYAMEETSTLKLYTKLFTDLTGKRSEIAVYTGNEEYRRIFAHASNMKVVSHLDKADIVLITDRSDLEHYRAYRERMEHRPILFATGFDLLRDCRDVVGAVYWRKGRSQLLFVTGRLKRYGIELSESFSSYMVEAP